jgi:transcriptional regulator with XRE-family HTH domain
MALLKKVNTRIGRKIRLRRIQLGIDVKSFAASVKITEARLQAFEAGKDSIGPELLAEIAAALDASSAYFFRALRTSFARSRQTRTVVRERAV